MVVAEQLAEAFLAKNATVRVRGPWILRSRAEDVEQVSGDLLHPRPVGIGFDPGDLDLACGDVDDEEDVVANQACDRQDLYGEEIRCGDHTEVRLDESSPRRLLAAERGRFDALLLENSLMVLRPISWPRFLRAPRRRVYPQAGISVAISITSRTISDGLLRPLAAVPGSPCAGMPIGEPRKVSRDSRKQDIGVASPSPAPSCFA